MSFWTNFRDSVIKPVIAVAAAPMTGGASLAIAAADRSAPAGSMTTTKPSAPPATASSPLTPTPASTAAPISSATGLKAPAFTLGGLAVPKWALWALGGVVLLVGLYFVFRKSAE